MIYKKNYHEPNVYKFASKLTEIIHLENDHYGLILEEMPFIQKAADNLVIRGILMSILAAAV